MIVREQKGFLLFELLTGLAIFAISIITVFSFYTLTIEGSLDSATSTNNSFIHQKNLEISKKIEEENPHFLDIGKYEISHNKSEWVPLSKSNLLFHLSFSGETENLITQNEIEVESSNLSFREDRKGQPYSSVWFNGKSNNEEVDADEVSRLKVIPFNNLNNLKIFTLSLWVSDIENKAEKSLIIKSFNPKENKYNYSLYKEDGEYIFEFLNKEGNYETLKADANTGNEWDFLTISYYFENGLKFYTNGNLQNEKSATINLFSDKNNFYIGSNTERKNTWSGYIDDIRLYNQLLTQDQINGLKNIYTRKDRENISVFDIEKKPILLWDINEKENCIIHDSSNNNYHGIINSSTETCSSNWTDDRNNNSKRSLDLGSNDYIKTIDSYLIETPFTISFWFKLPENIDSNILILENENLNIKYTNGKIIWTDDEETLSIDRNISADKWNNLILVTDKEQNNKKAYLNGNQTTFKKISSETLNEEEELILLKEKQNNFLLDDFRIYGEQLENDEIQTIFKSNKNYH